MHFDNDDNDPFEAPFSEPLTIMDVLAAVGFLIIFGLIGFFSKEIFFCIKNVFS